MPIPKIITFDPHWLDANGWMTGALSLLPTIPQDEVHVGLYLRQRQISLAVEIEDKPSRTEKVSIPSVLKFEFTHKRIRQYLTENQYVSITPFEAKVYIVRGDTEQWVETWGRYMDGLKVVWVKESGNINYRFPIDPTLVPINHAAFFRKALRDFRALHHPDNAFDDTQIAGYATQAMLQEFLERMHIDPRRMVARLRTPDAPLTQRMLLLREIIREQTAPIHSAENVGIVACSLGHCWLDATGEATNTKRSVLPDLLADAPRPMGEMIEIVEDIYGTDVKGLIQSAVHRERFGNSK